MITIIFGVPRAGKTALMTHLLTTAMFDRERYKSMAREIDRKNKGGFPLSTPKHCVAANYDIVGKKFGYNPRLSTKLTKTGKNSCNGNNNKLKKRPID